MKKNNGIGLELKQKQKHKYDVYGITVNVDNGEVITLSNSGIFDFTQIENLIIEEDIKKLNNILIGKKELHIYKMVSNMNINLESIKTFNKITLNNLIKII